MSTRRALRAQNALPVNYPEERDQQKLLVRMRNIHVDYGTVRALDGVDFDLYSGEIHAIVGEHRAGKSSLVKLLSGAVQKSSGEITYLDREIRSFSTESAIRAGIVMIYQDLNVIPSLNAVENIFAGRMIRRPLRGLDEISMIAKGRELFDRLNLDIDLDVPLFMLTQAEQLMVEFARVLLLDPRVVILDELSSKLTPREMQTIYDIILEYRREGKGIIYITHDADETLRLADRVTILKNGYRRGTERVADLDQYRLFQLTYSFALRKREIEANNMHFYLLRRYAEAFSRHLPIGIIVLDPQNQVQFVNIDSLSPEDADDEVPLNLPARTVLEDVLAGAQEEVIGDIVRAVESRDERSWDEVDLGEEQAVKVDAVPLRDESDSFMGTALLIQDISIDRFMKDYIIRTEKMATLAQVAAGVAHEINNPLFIIRNYIELLKSRELGGDELEKIEKIDKELRRIDEIVGTLLSFSRAKDRPQSEVDLVALLQDAILLLNHNISAKNIRVEQEMGNGPVAVSGDENRLKQLFLNLIINSIDAVLDGGLIRVEISKPEPDAALVTVADNGYGIPEDVQPKIFSPFFSTKITKKNTGLGLSICQEIAQAHNGLVSFRSVPGELTVFSVRLPLA